MTHQLPLFEATTRRDDPATSRAAAAKVSPVTGAHARAVLAYAAKQAHGFIDEELVAALPYISQSSARSRRATLVDLGYIEKFGEGSNSRGNRTTVWRITDKGKEAANG